MYMTKTHKPFDPKTSEFMIDLKESAVYGMINAEELIGWFRNIAQVDRVFYLVDSDPRETVETEFRIHQGYGDSDVGDYLNRDEWHLIPAKVSKNILPMELETERRSRPSFTSSNTDEDGDDFRVYDDGTVEKIPKFNGIIAFRACGDDIYLTLWNYACLLKPRRASRVRKAGVEERLELLKYAAYNLHKMLAANDLRSFISSNVEEDFQAQLERRQGVAA